jgi:hypothetical protein
VAQYQQCPHCKAILSVRQGESGQWIPYDLGTDQVHTCAGMAVAASQEAAASLLIPAGGRPVDEPDVRELLRREKKPGWIATAYGEIVTLVQTAITEQRVVNLQYAPPGGVLQERTIEPVEVQGSHSTSAVLRAYCRLRMAMTAFQVSHVSRAELMEERYDPALHPPETVRRESLYLGTRKAEVNPVEQRSALPWVIAAVLLGAAVTLVILYLLLRNLS